MSDEAAHKARPERRTVVGVDGSAASEQGLRWACEHVAAGKEPGEVLAVCVRTIAPLPEDLNVAAWPWRDDDPGDPVLAMLDEMAAQVGRDFPTVTIRRQVLWGHPTDELIRLSETAELVVVGARGHGAVAGILLGSVSRRLINHSHCTVAVVR